MAKGPINDHPSIHPLHPSILLPSRALSWAPGDIVVIGDTVTTQRMELWCGFSSVLRLLDVKGKHQTPLSGCECVHKSDRLRNCAAGKMSKWPLCETVHCWFCGAWAGG